MGFVAFSWQQCPMKYSSIWKKCENYTFRNPDASFGANELSQYGYVRNNLISNYESTQSNFSEYCVCVYVSLLSHFWLIHFFFHLHLLYQPYVGIFQATCVQSQQRQPTSAVAIATYEFQVSAANSQTVPTVATGVSEPLCCRLTLIFTLTSENLSLYIYIYITLLLFWSLYNYAAHAADIVAPTTAPIYIAGFNSVNYTATVINRQCIFFAVQKKNHD